MAKISADKWDIGGTDSVLLIFAADIDIVFV